MLELIISSLYFILPAYFANMCPAIFSKLNFPLGQPISVKYLGAHKTWRGFYTGYLGALLVLFLQSKLHSLPPSFGQPLLDYQNINLFLYAFLFGIGAITGDAIKSFFKRRLGIKPGRPFFPFDQLDFVIGALAFLWPVYQLPWPNILTILIITPGLHLLANIIAYFLKLKKVWW